MVPPRKASKRKKGVGRPLPVAPSDILPRERFLAATKEYFSILTRPLEEMRTPATSGRKFVNSYTRMVDTIVGVLFQRAAERHGMTSDETGIAVIAMGGYGRAELAPYSDVDLLILCRQKTDVVEAIAGSFIRLLWDVGFELGHAVESLLEIETAFAQDPDTKTALIESRWVCGSRRVARAVASQISRIRRRDSDEYLQRKIRDTLHRYEKYKNSFQLIEPNVKLSPGGLRDFQTLVWLGQVGRNGRGLRLLRQKGLLLRGEVSELEEAYDFLLRVRVELHLATSSKQDQLTVANQRDVAQTLGFRERSGQLAVEYFMRRYYMHTRAIHRITVDVLEELGNGRHVNVLRGKGRLRKSPGRVRLAIHRSRIKRDPLYLFRYQKVSGRKLDRGLRRRLEVALGDQFAGRKVMNQMRRDFPELLNTDENVSLVIRSMHETRFLMKIIPEYDRMTCLKRYDLYHHYTVDEHSFKVLENLEALGRADSDHTDPFVRLYSELPDKRLLFLAALLHDVGKIEGRGHAVKGAKLSRKILKRMFMDDESIEVVSALIENHLVMSHFSQRRDSSDIGTISSFCKKIGDRAHLKLLCLLTYADYKATSPVVWNDWKRTLLWELYVRAYDFMARKEKKPEAVYKKQKQRLLDSFSEGAERDAALDHLDLLPGTYLLTMTGRMVREHIEMIKTIRRRPFAANIDLNGAAYQVTFCTKDKPFRLSQLCGVLSIADFNILHAYAFTRSDGKVIDVFNVEDMTQSSSWEEVLERMDQMREALQRVFDGKLDLREATARHAAKWRRRVRTGIPVKVKVQFENDVSDDFTIIDIFAADRPGLLHDVTRALSEQDLRISRAKISTEANRVIDSFYVTDSRGRKCVAPEELRKLRKVLEEVVAVDKTGGSSP